MVTKINKNVLLVQEIPSNLIEEVILILKTEDKNIKTKTREILITEANEIIQDCSVKLQNEYENIRRKEKEEVYQRRKKRTNFIAVVGMIFFTFLISLIVKIFN